MPQPTAKNYQAPVMPQPQHLEITQDEFYQRYAAGERDFRNLTFKNIDLRQFDLRRVILLGADLTGAQLSRVNLSYANLSGAILDQADLGFAILQGVNLSDASLKRANLYHAFLNGANLSDAKLAGANLSQGNLAGANLSGADFSKTNLSWANLHKSNLSHTNLAGANLSYVDLDSANPEEAIIEQTTIEGVRLPSSVRVQQVNSRLTIQRITTTDHSSQLNGSLSHLSIRASTTLQRDSAPPPEKKRSLVIGLGITVIFVVGVVTVRVSPRMPEPAPIASSTPDTKPPTPTPSPTPSVPTGSNRTAVTGGTVVPPPPPKGCDEILAEVEAELNARNLRAFDLFQKISEKDISPGGTCHERAKPLMVGVGNMTETIQRGRLAMARSKAAAGTQEALVDAIAIAQQIPFASCPTQIIPNCSAIDQIYQEAQTQIAQWQQQVNVLISCSEVLNKAQAMAAKGTANALTHAINQAASIPQSCPTQSEEAKKLILQWQADLAKIPTLPPPSP